MLQNLTEEELKTRFPVFIHTFKDGHQQKVVPCLDLKKYPAYNGDNDNVSAITYIRRKDGNPWEFHFGYGYKECVDLVNSDIQFDSEGTLETPTRFDRVENRC